ncbi:cation efflux family-domain-containing protein [Morchella snyderi]|nr:cation efflux family-domain-containing protein [Morchella snyderi]
MWVGILLDEKVQNHVHDHDHGHHHEPKETKAPSTITKRLLRMSEGLPLLHGILIERDSRRIFYFMCLNFAFMLVQTCYGFTTGSLGLISDSVHMFFDCLALGVGLCAAVMSKWPPSMKYPYGLGKMDTLAGFANGIFLMLISVEIVWEAIERLQKPTEMSRLVELMIVSSLGLAVNLVGIMAFDHAHMHHGHSHSHGHSHEHAHESSHNHAHGHAHDDDHHHSHAEEPVVSPPSHNHSHDSENMHGIFLHILADTLGSFSVVISTLAIQYTGWTGFDPLASVFIAVLIFLSAIPLVKSSASNLLLAVPANTEYTLRETLAGVSGVKGVAGYTVPKFWDVDGVVRGCLHVQVVRGVDAEAVCGEVENWIQSGLGKVEVCVVAERGDSAGNCWCTKS